MRRTTVNTIRNRVTVEKAVSVMNERGVETFAYTGERDFKVWADIEPFGTRIADHAAETVPELEYRVTIRYRADISLHDRIVYGGRVLEQTLPPMDIDGRHVWLQLQCREMVEAGP